MFVHLLFRTVAFNRPTAKRWESTRTLGVMALFALVTNFAAQQAFAKDASAPKSGKTKQPAATAEIFTLLSTRCLDCHSADTAEGGYVLETIGALPEAGDSGKAAVIPGDAEASELFRRLVSEDADTRMPAGGPALSSNEIDQVRRWIESGAKTARWGPEQPLSEIASFDPLSHPAPEVYPRPIPVIGLAAAWSGTGDEGDASEEQTSSSSPAKQATETIIGGYRELLWLSPGEEDGRQRLAGFGRFIASIQPRPGHQQIAVAHGEPGIHGRVTLVQSAADGPPSFVDYWSGNDLPGGIAFSPQGERLAIGGLDGTLSVIEIASGDVIFASTSHADAILGVAWSADGREVLTASRDRTARVVRLEDGRAINNYTSHERAVFAIASVKAGTITMDETGTLRLWSGGSKQPRIQRQLNRSSNVGIVVRDDELYVAEPQQIIRTRVASKEISDGKDEEGNPKTRKVPTWQDQPPLTLDSPHIITSLAVAEDGTVWAGTHEGMIFGWRDGEPTEPRQAFPQ